VVSQVGSSVDFAPDSILTAWRTLPSCGIAVEYQTSRAWLSGSSSSTGNRELPGGSLASLINEAAQRLTKLHADVLLARELDLVEPGIPFLAAQRL
jgi:hypothetical protein